MTDASKATPRPIPADDPRRRLAVARPDGDDRALPHLSVAGDTYTTLLSGSDTAGRFTLIDMHVPPGGGPPPNRHDFEETFTVGDRVESRTAPPPELDEATRAARMAKAEALAPQYRTELLPPGT